MMPEHQLVRKDVFPTISAIAKCRVAWPYHARMHPGDASERVKSIVDAAERAARRLREQAEERAAERIAEADRAAANRVEAAEQEAAEILKQARLGAERERNEALTAIADTHAQAGERLLEAEQSRASAHEQAENIVAQAQAQAEGEAKRLLDDAREQYERALAETRHEVEGMLVGARKQVEQVLADGEGRIATQRADAQEKANEMRARARAEAREIVSEAHLIAREVLRDGTEVSGNLRDLAVSLRTNAERLLRDVRLTHGGMTARLDQAAPGSTPSEEVRRNDGLGRPPRRGAPREGPEGDLDVPEFMPRG